MYKLHSLKAIAQKYGISIPMLKKLISQNKITRVKVGVKNFISEEAIEEYINQNTINANNS